MPEPSLLAVQVAALGLCLWLESVVPVFLREPGQRIRHDARNLVIGVVNGLVTAALFSGLMLAATRWGEIHGFGLLHWVRLPHGVEFVAGFILFDIWMYWWHWANHNVRWLWRFHRMHHSDLALDVTSAHRFHAGELALSTLFRLAVIPSLGISIENLLWYELVLQPVIYFHHSNIALPERWDRWMRLVLVSPNMHRVHHSIDPSETNSNYSSIFSVWDRLWSSYRRREVKTITYGLAQFREPQWQTVFGMLKTPLA